MMATVRVGASLAFGSERARRLHAEAPPIDLHTDSLLWTRLGGYDVNRRHRPPLPGAAFFGHVDVPRALEGGMGAFFLGLVSFPHLDRSCRRAVERTLDCFERACAESEGKLRAARSAEDVEAANRDGVLAGLLGIEGAHALEGDVDAVDAFARRGVRYLGLLHFTANACGAPQRGLGQGADEPLTEFGREVIARCEATGVIVDLAHINARGFEDACAAAKRPPIVSHAGLLGVHASWRNVPDAHVRRIAQLGGVLGVIFCPRYLGRDGIEGVVAHLEHLLDVGGEDVPALGSDWDGFIVPSRGLEEPQKLPLLTDALLARGHTERVVRKILRENALRVLREVPPRVPPPKAADSAGAA
jgi:membrane dipeptidase